MSKYKLNLQPESVEQFVEGLRKFAKDHCAELKLLILSKDIEMMIDSAYIKGQLKYPVVVYENTSNYVKTVLCGVPVKYVEHLDMSHPLFLLETKEEEDDDES